MSRTATLREVWELLGEIGFPVPVQALRCLAAGELLRVNRWAWAAFNRQMGGETSRFPSPDGLPATVRRHFPPHCRECGCTHTRPCSDEQLGECWWVESDLCSHCAVERVGGVPV